MADLLNDSAKPLADKRWLMITRVTAVTPIVLALALTLWVRITALRRGCSDDFSYIGTAYFWLVTPPYIICLVLLLKKSTIKLKEGLAWAVVAGSFWGGIALFFALMDVFGGSAKGAWEPLLLTIIQITLVTSAIKTYYSTRPEKGDVRVLLKQALLFIPYLILLGMVAAALPDLYYTEQHRRAAPAVGALRKINSAQPSYASTYPQGFSPTLAALGPPAGGTAPSDSATGLIDSDLARGAKFEYTFRYTPGAPNAAGKTTAYTLTATPREPGCTGWKRFFTDQSGTIHETSENRPPTINDPAL